MCERNPCARCGQPIPKWKRRDAVYCSVLCRERQRLGRRIRAPRPEVKSAGTCARCGAHFIGRAGRKYCCRRCCVAAQKEKQRRRDGRTQDRVQRVCDACGAKFTTRRWHQLRCSRQCAQYIRNRRHIDKRRKTTEPPRVSHELMARRKAAIHARWDEKERQRRMEVAAP